MFKSTVITYINFLLKNSDECIIALTGPAGVGKTFVSNNIESNSKTIYSIDYRFIGSSQERKLLLEFKNQNGIDGYIDACNQFNWWDWDRIEQDIIDLSHGKQVEIENCYNRASGKNDFLLILHPSKKIIVEGALLGGHSLITHFDHTLFLYRDCLKRFLSLVEKDMNKRTFNEIVARFLITQYSESFYYNTYIFREDPNIRFFNLESDDFCTLTQMKYLYKDQQFIPIFSDLITNK